MKTIIPLFILFALLFSSCDKIIKSGTDTADTSEFLTFVNKFKPINLPIDRQNYQTMPTATLNDLDSVTVKKFNLELENTKSVAGGTYWLAGGKSWTSATQYVCLFYHHTGSELDDLILATFTKDGKLVSKQILHSFYWDLDSYQFTAGAYIPDEPVVLEPVNGEWSVKNGKIIVKYPLLNHTFDKKDLHSFTYNLITEEFKINTDGTIEQTLRNEEKNLPLKVEIAKDMPSESENDKDSVAVNPVFSKNITGEWSGILDNKMPVMLIIESLNRGKNIAAYAKYNDEEKQYRFTGNLLKNGKSETDKLKLSEVKGKVTLDLQLDNEKLEGLWSNGKDSLRIEFNKVKK